MDFFVIYHFFFCTYKKKVSTNCFYIDATGQNRREKKSTHSSRADWNLSSVWKERLKWLLCMSQLTTKVVYCLAKQYHHISLTMKGWSLFYIPHSLALTLYLIGLSLSRQPLSNSLYVFVRCGIHDITMGNAVTFLSYVHRITGIRCRRCFILIQRSVNYCLFYVEVGGSHRHIIFSLAYKDHWEDNRVLKKLKCDK